MAKKTLYLHHGCDLSNIDGVEKIVVGCFDGYIMSVRPEIVGKKVGVEFEIKAGQAEGKVFVPDSKSVEEIVQQKGVEDIYKLVKTEVTYVCLEDCDFRGFYLK